MQRAIPRPFTPEEDAAIVAQYSRGPLSVVAAQLGREYNSVTKRSRELVARGVLDEHTRWYQPRWTDADDDALKELLGSAPLRVIARRLGRTEEAVRVRKKRLGLRQTDDFLTMREVARILAVDDHLARRWIAEGLLRARRSVVPIGRNRMWRCEVEDLERFLREHPERYDWRRIEDEPFRGIARAAHRADPLLTVDQAARVVGVQCETVRRHLRRGWLSGLKVPGTGKHGVWLVRSSLLTGFRSRKPDSVGVVRLGSVAEVNSRRRATRRVQRQPAVAPAVRRLATMPKSRRVQFRAVQWRAS